jgi:hypothetical protein
LGVILDEVQRTPDLFSYLQGFLDEERGGPLVLTGSQNFLLRSAGITCAFCHSTVDDSVAPGAAARLDRAHPGDERAGGNSGRPGRGNGDPIAANVTFSFLSTLSKSQAPGPRILANRARASRAD